METWRVLLRTYRGGGTQGARRGTAEFFGVSLLFGMGRADSLWAAFVQKNTSIFGRSSYSNQAPPDSARTRSAQALAGCGDGISPRADARGLHRDRHPEAYPWQVGCFLRLGINFKNLSSGSKLSPRPTQ